MISLTEVKGRISADIMSKKTKNGGAFSLFTIAVPRNESFTDYFTVKCFGETAKTVSESYVKGSDICFSGTLETYVKDGVRQVRLVAESIGVAAPEPEPAAADQPPFKRKEYF